jgi:hypothetical protein
MRSFALAVIVATATACAHNYADGFVASAAPDADRIRIGAQSVLFVDPAAKIVAVCTIADPKSRHPECHPIASWSQGTQQGQATKPGPATSAKGQAPAPTTPMGPPDTSSQIGPAQAAREAAAKAPQP